jgi:hypothetical protein
MDFFLPLLLTLRSEQNKILFLLVKSLLNWMIPNRLNKTLFRSLQWDDEETFNPFFSLEKEW